MDREVSSLIGALFQKGVSVYDLAQNKAVDLRQTCSCWLSSQVPATDPGIQFDRILCFEPLVRGDPPDVVGDIFRALTPFLGADPPIRMAAIMYFSIVPSSINFRQIIKASSE